MKKLFFLFATVMIFESVLGTESKPLPPIPPMAPYHTVTALPYKDTSLQTDWSALDDPQGWNSMSVHVYSEEDPNTADVQFSYPSDFFYLNEEQTRGTFVEATDCYQYHVHALLLPLIKVPVGVSKLLLTYDYYVAGVVSKEVEDEFGDLTTLHNSIVAFATDGEANRNDAETFMDACLLVMGSGVVPQETEQWVRATQEFNLADYPSREINIILMALYQTPPTYGSDGQTLMPTYFGFSNVSVTDPDAPSVGCIGLESADKNISVSKGQIRVSDLAANTQVELVSASGVVLSQQLVSSSATISVAQSGLYLVRLTQEGKQSLSKVLIP